MVRRDAGLICRARALFDPMESDMRSSLLIGRIFVDEPASTSSENALAAEILIEHCRYGAPA